MRLLWDKYFMAIAKVVSTRSTCNSRKVGCVIVKDKCILSTGYNGASSGKFHCVNDIFRDGRPRCYRRYMNILDENKYDFCVGTHSELNAISMAAKLGISLNGATIFCTLMPCINCFKAIIAAGIDNIVYEYKYESSNNKYDEFWKTLNHTIDIKQIKMDNCDIEKVMDALNFPTSKRLLKATD